jgi:hypothetical protein
MHTHIAKALKAQSQAIRTAVKTYNDAAACLHPPRKSLDIASVLECTFIAEFDLLRDGRGEAIGKPWTHAAERITSTNCFKIQWAREE